MAFRAPKKQARGGDTQGVCVPKTPSSAKGKTPSRAHIKDSATIPSNAARSSRPATPKTSSSVLKQEGVGASQRGTPAGARVASSRTAGSGRKRSADVDYTFSLSARSAGQDSGANTLRRTSRVSAGNRYKASRGEDEDDDDDIDWSFGEEWSESDYVEYQPKSQRRTSNANAAARNRSEPAQKKPKPAESSSSVLGGPKGKAGGRNAQSAGRTPEWVLPSQRPDKSLKRKKSGVLSLEQNPSPSLGEQFGSAGGPPAKRTRLADSQPSEMPQGKKSLLRRAQEDMLVSSCPVTDRSSGKPANSKSKTGVPTGGDVSRPLTRHVVQNASSSRFRNSRLQGLKENRGTLERFEDSDSDLPTQGKKKTVGKFEGAGYNSGKNSSLQSQKRKELNRCAGVSGKAAGHVHGVGGSKKTGARGQPTSAAARLRHPATSQCEREEAQNPDRPKRYLSSKKKCKSCDHHAAEHSDGSSVSDEEWSAKSGKNQDRSWKTPARPGRQKLKAGGGKVKKKAKQSFYPEPLEVITYIITPPYPVKLQSASGQELDLYTCLAKKELPSEETPKCDTEMKDEDESSALSPITQKPAGIVFQAQDFYVVAADSDTHVSPKEPSTFEKKDNSILTKDKSVEEGSKDTAQKEELKAESSLHTADLKDEKDRVPVTGPSPPREEQAVPVKVPTGPQKEEERKEPAASQSDRPRSQVEQIPSAAVHSPQKNERDLTLEENKSGLQSMDVSEREDKQHEGKVCEEKVCSDGKAVLVSEQTVCADIKETDSQTQQGLPDTETVQQENCKHTKHQSETTATSQTHTSPGVVSSENSLPASSPQEEPSTQAAAVSAAKEEETGGVGTQNGDEIPVVANSRLEENHESVIALVPERSMQTESGNDVQAKEDPCALLERRGLNMDCKIVDDKTSEQTDNAKCKTADTLDESASDAQVSMKSDQEKENSTGLSSGKDTDTEHVHPINPVDKTDFMNSHMTTPVMHDHTTTPDNPKQDSGTLKTTCETVEQNNAAEESQEDRNTHQTGETRETDTGQVAGDVDAPEKESDRSAPENPRSETDVRLTENSQALHSGDNTLVESTSTGEHDPESRQGTKEDSCAENAKEQSVNVASVGGDPVQGSDVLGSRVENSQQAEGGGSPSRNGPHPTRDMLGEDRTTSASNDAAESASLVCGWVPDRDCASQNTAGGCADFVAVKSASRENHTPGFPLDSYVQQSSETFPFRTGHPSPAQNADTPEGKQNSDRTETQPAESEKNSREFHQDTCDKGLGQGDLSNSC